MLGAQEVGNIAHRFGDQTGDCSSIHPQKFTKFGFCHRDTVARNKSVLRGVCAEWQQLDVGEWLGSSHQTKAGEPTNAPGSPGAGMSGLLHATVWATCSVTARHSRGFQPSARTTTWPSMRRNTNAGSVESASCFTKVRSGSQKTRVSLAIGPKNARASSGVAVTT